jgi:hypothetical protein
MRHTLTQAIKIVFSPETILPFLVGSVSLAVFGNAIYDIFKKIFGEEIPDLIKIAGISLLILAMAIGIVSWVIAQRLDHLSIDVPFEVQQKKLDRKYKGLILLVSNSEACRTAIQFHQPTLKRCWLVCSPQTLEQAEELRRQFRECVDPPIVVNDVYDPLQFRDSISAIYEARLPNGWQDTDVIADYTGMTVHASVGTVLACFEKHRPLQYTPARHGAQDRIVGSLHPIKVTLSPYPVRTDESSAKQKLNPLRSLASIKKALGL